MLLDFQISGRLLAKVSRPHESTSRTIQRLIPAEIARNELPPLEGKPTARVHLTEKAALVVDTLRHSYRAKTGLWPEQN